MKKLFTTGLIALLCMALASCGKDTGPTDPLDNGLVDECGYFTEVGFYELSNLELFSFREPSVWTDGRSISAYWTRPDSTQGWLPLSIGTVSDWAHNSVGGMGRVSTDPRCLALHELVDDIKSEEGSEPAYLVRYPKVRFAVSYAFPPSISDADALPSEQPAEVELAINLVWARRTISGGAIVDEILATEPHVAVLSCDQGAVVKKKWDAKLNNEPSNFCRREETSPGVFEERCLRFSAELLATDCGFSMVRQTFQTANGQVQASVGGRISKGNRGFVLRVDEIAL